MDSLHEMNDPKLLGVRRATKFEEITAPRTQSLEATPKPCSPLPDNEVTSAVGAS